MHRAYSLKEIEFLALEGVEKIGENQCSENCCYRPRRDGRRVSEGEARLGHIKAALNKKWLALVAVASRGPRRRCQAAEEL